ncbi:MAG: 50S ribosomal protein L25, partial [bacterium]
MLFVMGEQYSIAARVRDPKASLVGLRQAGQLPGVVYGKKIKPQPIQADGVELQKLFHKAGESSLVTLQVDGQEYTTLLKEPQYHPRTGKLVHLDFHQISLDEKIRAEVPLVFENEAPAVSDFGAVLV